MQICFYLPSLKNDINNAIFGSMYTSFFKQMELQGLKVKFAVELNEIAGDALVVAIGGGGEPLAAKAMHMFKGPVILSIYNSHICFYRSFLKRWKSRIMFAYNPDFATLNYKKYNSVGIQYYHFPFGSDESVFYPMNIEKKYDIAFLGNGNSGFGRERYIKRLLDYSQKNRLRIFLAGSGWDKYGFPYLIVKHGAETNLIYNSSKLCINIHNDRQFAGIDIEMDANNRLFDLSMAGCCQVCNGVQVVEKYFNKSEVATADDPDQWIEKIDYYLQHESEREILGQNARRRALADHTWQLRAIDFIRIFEENYSKYNNRNQSVSILVKIVRYADQFITPPYLLKEIRIVRFFLTKIGLYTKK